MAARFDDQRASLCRRLVERVVTEQHRACIRTWLFPVDSGTQSEAREFDGAFGRQKATRNGLVSN